MGQDADVWSGGGKRWGYLRMGVGGRGEGAMFVDGVDGGGGGGADVALEEDEQGCVWVGVSVVGRGGEQARDLSCVGEGVVQGMSMDEYVYI